MRLVAIAHGYCWCVSGYEEEKEWLADLDELGWSL